MLDGVTPLFVVGNEVGAVVGLLFGDVGLREGDVFGDVVGLLVGDVFGDLVGDVVGDLVGDVRLREGDVVGDLVGLRVGDAVGLGLYIFDVYIPPPLTTAANTDPLLDDAIPTQ